MNAEPWTRAQFEEQLRAKETRYHTHHPFHLMMNEGRLSREAIRGWVANRFYYQATIPMKDAAILANCRDREVRRRWITRILDQDGDGAAEGGLEAWLRLGEAVGLERARLWSFADVLPAVCSSLTEMFAPAAHQDRLATWPRHYPWIAADGLAYFRMRLSQARRDVADGLELTLNHFTTREAQERALEILQFKLDILWTILDACQLAYCR